MGRGPRSLSLNSLQKSPFSLAVAELASSLNDTVIGDCGKFTRLWRCTFDAMGMQRVPVHEAFYSASSIGGGWQMPPM